MSKPLSPIFLDPTNCRQRQRALLGLLDEMKVDRAVLTRPEHVQYLTGFRPHRLMSAAVSLGSSGRCLLVSPNCVPDSVAADDVIAFEAQCRHVATGPTPCDCGSDPDGKPATAGSETTGR